MRFGGQRYSATTAVVLIAILITDLSTTGSTAPDETELAEKLQRLDNLVINYETKRARDTRRLLEQPGRTSVVDLQYRLGRVYHRLGCSYAVSASLYLRMMDLCFFKQPTTTMQMDGNMAAYMTFGNEAKSMLATVHNEPGLSAVEYLLWMFYLHAESLGKYAASAATGQTVGNAAKAVVAADHESVTAFVRDYLDRCDGFEPDTEFAALTEQLSGGGGSEDKIMAIVRVKVMLLAQLDGNRRCCGVSTAGQTGISPKALRLNDLLSHRSAVQSLFERFMDRKDWHLFLARLHELYGPGVDRRLPVTARMKSLARFQYTVVQLLKVAMLRTAWKYLKCARNAAKLYGVNRHFDGVVGDDNEHFLAELVKFCAVLQLNTDSDMSAVLRLFRRPPDDFARESVAKRDQQTVGAVYNTMLKQSYLTALWEPVSSVEYPGTSKPKIVDSVVAFVVSSRKHRAAKEIINLAQVFVAFVELTFGAVDFKVINSFINPFLHTFLFEIRTGNPCF